MRDSKGFTIVEMLLVLSVISITMLIIPSYQFYGSMQGKYDMLRMKNKLETIQLQAISTKEKIGVEIRDNYLYAQQEKTLISSHCYVSDDHITFNGLGNVNQANTLQMKCFNKTYKLVILLGSGRMYVE